MKKMIVACLFSGMIVLSGCSSESSIEQELADALSTMNGAEKDYRTAQTGLTKLERSEQQQFDKLMELTQNEQEKLTKKVAKLEESLAQRLVYLEQEESAMRKARESVSIFDAIIERATNNEKKQLEKLQKNILTRYELHTAIVEEYIELASVQQELYDKITVEGAELSELRELVDEVNVQNGIVQAVITAFNDETDKVNILKEDFMTSTRQEK